MRSKTLFPGVALLVVLLSEPTHTQYTWQKYAGNPILAETSGSIDDPSCLKYATEPSVIYDTTLHLYRMWFTSFTYYTGAGFRTSYAISFDGVEWFLRSKNPVFSGGPPGSFDSMVRCPSVIFDGTEYKMYYMGVDLDATNIGLATSTDGKTWQRYWNYPILIPSGPESWDSQGLGFPSVYFDGTTYMMWFTGGNGERSGIGLATSTDGTHWTEHPGNPVFEPSSVGWDSLVVGSGAVVRVNGTYYLFYGGASTPVCCHTSFGLATSTEGIHWQRYAGNPVLKPGIDWDGASLGNLSVLFKDNTFHMWYSALSSTTGHWQTGYATSPYVSSVVPDRPEIPQQSRLLENYPNPFNPETIIGYSVAKKGRVRIAVFDELGREVTTLVDVEQGPGDHSVRWDARGLASGVYYCRMAAGGMVDSKKMVLLK